MEMEKNSAHGQVAALTPGRVRIRMHGPHRHLSPKVKSHLATHAGISEVTTNELTGSILVHYDRHKITCDDVLAMCRDVGVVVSGLAEAEVEPVGAVSAGDPLKEINRAIVDLDRRLSNVTGEKLDLRLLGPLLLGALGTRQLVVGGLGSISGYLLLILAVNSSLRLRQRGRRVKTHAPLQIAAAPG